MLTNHFVKDISLLLPIQHPRSSDLPDCYNILHPNAVRFTLKATMVELPDNIFEQGQS